MFAVSYSDQLLKEVIDLFLQMKLLFVRHFLKFTSAAGTDGRGVRRY